MCNMVLLLHPTPSWCLSKETVPSLVNLLCSQLLGVTLDPNAAIQGNAKHCDSQPLQLCHSADLLPSRARKVHLGDMPMLSALLPMHETMLPLNCLLQGGWGLDGYHTSSAKHRCSPDRPISVPGGRGAACCCSGFVTIACLQIPTA